MTQVMLLVSGAIVAVVLAVNDPFVSWWVGESRFGGIGAHGAAAAGMLVRHFNVTIVYTLFCFGYERRLALTTIADGVSGVVLMWLLVPRLGLQGAAAAMLIAALTVSLPANLVALAREQGVSPWAFAASMGPWFARFAAVAAGAAVLTLTFQPRGLVVALPLVLAIAAAYLAVMMPELRRPPLGPLLRARLQPWLPRMPRLARRLAVETLESTS